MSTVSTWPAMAENWLDARGKPAWLGAAALGLVLFWPIGLAILAYRFVGRKFIAGSPIAKAAPAAAYAFRSSGNQAFDSYKAETLRRLEDEQRAFESFLQRLREARDKAEFDQFMKDRGNTPATPEAAPATGATGNRDDDAGTADPRAAFA
ncbi:hypothetical protein BV394_00945 [Brevirhabdus pacifica]|uniref:Uncharacterized protein n=1 Tax=Brevirhabdus pacifica TaxID=1267768 RepID=A0A1U7DEN7_9RHOB|nr:DUF2852 domain-containing protein [Brevirhabdus pacifica]APX88470.1 hypothetical protein BV394_00945 [Brevirhabdus pacifica]PJJ87058.1 uncharacterized protein DUF2852 [Brevirhabdus pacifica]